MPPSNSPFDTDPDDEADRDTPGSPEADAESVDSPFDSLDQEQKREPDPDRNDHRVPATTTAGDAGAADATASAKPSGYDHLDSGRDLLSFIDTLRYLVRLYSVDRRAQLVHGVVLVVSLASSLGGLLAPIAVLAGLTIPFVVLVGTIMLVFITYDDLGGPDRPNRALPALVGPTLKRAIPTGITLLFVALICGFLTIFLIIPGIWAARRLALTLPAVVLEDGLLNRPRKRSYITVRDTPASGPVTGLVVVSFIIVFGATISTFTAPGVGAAVIWLILPVFAPAYTLTYLEYRPEYFINTRTGATF